MLVTLEALAASFSQLSGAFEQVSVKVDSMATTFTTSLTNLHATHTESLKIMNATFKESLANLEASVMDSLTNLNATFMKSLMGLNATVMESLAEQGSRLDGIINDLEKRTLVISDRP